jgi:TetR/AcrR family transcriptional regulator
MRAEDRRELVIQAAVQVFGDHGYFGTTTDHVAKAAAVSQPYVVRIFGSKENLFVEVLDRTLEELHGSFAAALAQCTDDGVGNSECHDRLGHTYKNLLRDSGMLLTMMHAFLLGSDPVIGPRARAGFTRIYSFLRHDAGMTPDEASSFLATGMLINTMATLRMGDDVDVNDDAAEFVNILFPGELETLVRSKPTPDLTVVQR